MRYIKVGSRIPSEYFLTTGCGESNAGSKGLPFETGSYDAALNSAGIENANIVKYTSVIPTNAKKITREKGLNTIQWGEVLECIMAQANGKTGDKIAAAVIITNVSKNGKHLGGFACEYSGSDSKEVVGKSLIVSIRGMIERRGYGILPKNVELYKDNITDKGVTVHPGYAFVYDSITIKKAAGSVLAAICFVSFNIPLLSTISLLDGKEKTSNKRRTRKKRR